MIYNFKPTDFEQAFNFSIIYYLDKNIHSGRTSGEPRGLGAILDSFLRGKLAEVAVIRMFNIIQPEIECKLDFKMKKANEVAPEPDIIEIIKNKNIREPNIFIEIKNTGINDRWIGLTEEQLSTMKKGAGKRKIFSIYCSHNPISDSENPSSTDLVGMYLKNLTGHKIFQEFSDLNVEAKLEFILSSEILETYGTKFPIGKLIYETNLFQPINRIRKTNGELLSRIQKLKVYNEFKGDIDIPRRDGTIDKEYSKFKIKGDFTIYKKSNEKSIPFYIECQGNCILNSPVFGSYHLEADNIYSFNLDTLGRDPICKRNNLWIAKRRVYELISEGKILNPKEQLKIIADTI